MSLLTGAGLATALPSLAAPPSGDSALVGKLGSRPAATNLPIAISDQVRGQVDVGTGNLMITVGAITLPGVSGSTTLGAAYNSLAPTTPVGSIAPRWALSAGSAGSLSSVPAGMIFTSGDGYSTLFTPVAGSTTAYVSAPGVKVDLVKNGSTGWTLTSRTSAQVLTLDADGRTTKIADRNGNATSYTWVSGKLTTVVSSKGALSARTANLSYDSYSGLLSGISQTATGGGRSISLTRDSNNNLSTYTDVLGNETSFTYTSGRITKVVSPTAAVTNIVYDATGKVASIEQVNTSAGSPGNSLTRLTYPSSTQTLLAGPNTDPAVAVATGPRTIYTLNTNHLVTSVTDPMGRARSKTYTANFDTQSSTEGTGATAGTTTNTFGANNGQSLTKSQSASGASSSFAYANTAASTKYLPSSSTSDAGNQSLYTYNGAGNTLTFKDSLAATATLTYNTDGTVATATAPGNGTNKTVYANDSNHQLVTTTPVTGSSLTAQTVTYNKWGQTATATTGTSTTITYSYDTAGRLTGTAFSDGTPTVTYTYNPNGQLLTRVDGAGTTTNTYDHIGRLTSVTNTAGGGTITYGYDKASNLISTTDTRGTSTYAYDTSGTLTSLTYTQTANNAVKNYILSFATDNRGRRTDSWLQSGANNTVWSAHSHTDYDTTGRVSRTTAQQGSGNTSNTTVMDLSYCHAAGTTSPNCTTTTANDRSNVQWIRDNLTGSTIAYTYDGANRVIKAATSGGTKPAITYTYTYDSRGNRLTATSSGATTTSQTFTVNAANQITNTGYTYDGTGNLTKDPNGTYTYNGASQLTKTTKNGVTYKYTYAGSSNNELLSQTTPQGTYKFVYGRPDAQGQPVIEQLSNNDGTAYIEHDPTTGQPLLLRTSSGMQSLYIYDALGDPTTLITSNGSQALAQEFDPYGTVTVTTASGGLGAYQNPYAYRNGTQDRTTGWIKYGARYYSPTTGRWTQQDTLDTPLDPANANRYAYAANNPINNSDPTGNLSSCGQAVAAAGLFGGATAAFGLGAVFSTGTIIGAPAGAVFGVAAAISGFAAAASTIVSAVVCDD